MLENQIKTILNRYGAKIVTQLQQRLLEDDTKATGRAVESLGYEIKESRTLHKLNVKGKKYIFAVDSGRTSGATPPPISKIKRWIKARGIKPLSNKNKKPKSLAIAISKSIGKLGTMKRFGYGKRGTDLLKFVIERNAEPLSQELLQVLKEDIERQIKETQQDVR